MREIEAARMLSQIPHMTIATARKDGKPWNSPVFFGYDEVLNLIWSSAVYSEHSKNIRQNNRVFVVVYEAGVYPTRAVYIEAEARELSHADEITKFFEYYEARLHDGTFSAEMFHGYGPSRMYTATPKRVWIHDTEVIDDHGHYIDIRVDLDLTQLLEVL